jgi:hypothetical protein
VILLSSDGVDPGLASAVQARLTGLAEASGLGWRGAALSPQDLDSQVSWW